nr:peptidase domain-containing ABC transporter [Chroococcidiopsis sp. [FACHB-1243]]
MEFSRAFKIGEFQLGDELINYAVPAGSENFIYPKRSSCNFYIVYQGRVRLLDLNIQNQQEVSTMVLEAGETFGAEIVFCDRPILTRAIAASTVQVAWMPLATLETWLEQLPALQDYLHQQAMQRQCLIFFKTTTELRLLPSKQLRQLLPYLVEKKVNSGQLLVEATPAASGRFWLRSGKIQTQGEYPTPVVGQNWGYPEPTLPADWLAQTDLLVYYLPRKNWETAQAIAPVLATTVAETNSAKVSSNGQRRLTAAKVAARLSPSAEHQNNQQGSRKFSRSSPESNSVVKAPQTKSAAVAFPQPIRKWHLNRLFWQHPFIQQQSASDCGAACLAMVGRYWGKQFGLNSLRELAGIGRSGASLKGLARAAESLGFQTRPVRASLGRLINQTNPWIAHWQGDHYVVVYRAKGARILIADPAVGKRSLSRQEFEQGWTGYALLLDPTDRLATAKTEKSSLGRYWGLLWLYRSVIWQIILVSVLLQVFGLVTPLFTQVILDRVVVQKSLITLHVFALGLLLFGVWRVGLVAIRQYLLDYCSNRLDLTLISGFISHALMLPLQFFESRQVGDIITRVQENQKIQLFLTRQAVATWLDALMIFVYLGLMIYYNWKLTLLVLAIIPPIIILTLVATPLMQRISREIFKQDAAETSSLVEMLTGVATVKTAAAERDLRWRWEDLFTTTLNTQFRSQKLSNGLEAFSGLINTVGSTLLLWYGAKLVIQDQLSIGEFVAFNMLIGNVIDPILALVSLWYEFQEVIISVERLDDVFSAQPEERPDNSLLRLPRLRGDMRFENVTFRYDQEEERNTLQNICFEVCSGQTVAIVGRSGSGKSTLVSLMQGLYHPNSGRIWIDDRDLRHASPQSLRSQLGVVPQECFLFSGTILENITLYRPEFTIEQAIEVAKLAEAHAFIQDLPLGYNTKVGERGSTLSGGQRQRIAIARALLGDPRILILDEATSSLDTESERRFQQNLARISRDRTTFVIAHRLSTVRHADCILVLNQGILVERGTHEQLIAKQGLYYHLAQQQLEI